MVQALGRADHPQVDWSWREAALSPIALVHEIQLEDGRMARVNLVSGDDDEECLSQMPIYDVHGNKTGEFLMVPAD